MTKPFTHDDIMPFGKYQLTKLRNIPASYLLWWYDQEPKNYPELVAYIEEHMESLEESAEEETFGQDEYE